MPLSIHLRDEHNEQRLLRGRLIVVAAAVILILGVTGLRLGWLQIAGNEHFTTLSDNNRLRIEPLPPPRGLIFDRYGRVLAENRPTFGLEIVPEQVPDIDATLDRLSELIELTDKQRAVFWSNVAQVRRFESVPLRLGLEEDELSRFAVNRHHFPGVEIQARLVRHYPQGDLTAHVIGHVGRLTRDDLSRVNTSDYRATNHIGKTGLERQYESLLHGAPGFRQVETNAQGRVLDVASRNAPTAGENLHLTLDVDLQRVASEALAPHRGAVVALDPSTGEILALVSRPGFDPNAFVQGLSQQAYQDLLNAPSQPLYNRALRGSYPPGSTVKQFYALAGLEYGVREATEREWCRGSYTLEGHERPYRCWKNEGHGATDVVDAIRESCDVYFYHLAEDLEIDRMHQFMSQYGFGQPTAIDLPGEGAGLMPSRRWKRESRGAPWYPGETIISGIGQGYTLATPLQLAVATAALANGGDLIRPRLLHARETSEGSLVKLDPAPPRRRLEHAPEHLRTIHEGMVAVNHGEDGTARSIGEDAPYRIAGKTGTSQVFGLQADQEYDEDEIVQHLRDHALYVGYAPAERPQIAIAVIAENAGSGGRAAAPIARTIMDFYLGESQDDHDARMAANTR